MSELNAVDSIVIEEARREFLGAEGDELAKLRAAMKGAKKNFLIEQLDPREAQGRGLRAAVGGACLALGMEHPFAQRIAREHRELGKLGAALEALQKGIPVDMERMVREQEAEGQYEKVGLLELWRAS